MATLAAVGLGVSAAGTALGAYQGMRSGAAASKVAAEQNRIAMLQYLEQQRIAREQERMAKASTTDARGNTQRYVEGYGWVTDTTPMTRELISASDAEELARNTTDALRSRYRRGVTANRQAQESLDADAERGRRGEGARSLSATEAALVEAGTARAVSGAEDMRRRIGLQNLRTGGTGSDEALARLGRGAMMDTRTAIADARLEAPNRFVSDRQSREGASLDRYNLLAGRASAADDVSFAPTSLGQSLGQGQLAQQALAQRGLAQASNVQAPTLRYAEDRTPVGVASFASALGGLANIGDKYLRNRGASAASDSLSLAGGSPF